MGGERMALFSNKEFEALQVENQRLQSELERLRSREEFNRATIVSLNQGVDNFRDHIFSLETTIRDQTAEIEDLRRQLAAASIRPHNERGAGRKRKVTAEQATFIRSLRMKGMSYGYIADTLTAKFGEKWNKTTVRNAFIAEKN